MYIGPVWFELRRNSQRVMAWNTFVLLTSKLPSRKTHTGSRCYLLLYCTTASSIYIYDPPAGDWSQPWSWLNIGCDSVCSSSHDLRSFSSTRERKRFYCDFGIWVCLRAWGAVRCSIISYRSSVAVKITQQRKELHGRSGPRFRSVRCVDIVHGGVVAAERPIKANSYWENNEITWNREEKSDKERKARTKAG